MSDKKRERVVILENKEIADQIFDMWIQSESIAKLAKAGQFLDLYCEDGSRLLPRPISICEIDGIKNMLRLVFRIAEESRNVSGCDWPFRKRFSDKEEISLYYWRGNRDSSHVRACKTVGL